MRAHIRLGPEGPAPPAPVLMRVSMLAGTLILGACGVGIGRL